MNFAAEGRYAEFYHEPATSLVRSFINFHRLFAKFGYW